MAFVLESSTKILRQSLAVEEGAGCGEEGRNLHLRLSRASAALAAMV